MAVGVGRDDAVGVDEAAGWQRDGRGRDPDQARPAQRVRAGQELGRVLAVVVGAHARGACQEVVREVIGIYIYCFYQSRNHSFKTGGDCAGAGCAVNESKGGEEGGK